MNRPRARQGFVLVEALVALVLLAVALAASIALVVQAVRHERWAGERGVALRQASSLADVLRTLARRDGRPLQAIAEPAAVAECPDSPADCAAEARAQQQLERWQAALAGEMPVGAVATVRHVAGPPAAYALSVSWPRSGDGGLHTVRLLVEP